MESERRRQLTFHLDAEPVLGWRIGEVQVTRVVEGISEFPRGFLPALDDDRIDACQPWAAPYVTPDRGHLLLSTHSFVVETPDHVVVVDTCVGPHRERPMGTDPDFEQRLVAALPDGLESIDVVVCTHLHFDHVGWNTVWTGSGYAPRFPRARYLVTDAELRSVRADDRHGVLDDLVQPLLDAGVVDVVAPDHRIDDHVRLRPSPGHTPGHVCVAIESAGEAALITGDAAHSPMQFTFPDVAAVRADADSAMSTRTREELVAELADSTTMVLGTHFPTPTAGRLRRAPHGVWFEAWTM